jgi:hypothetical protein
MVRAVMFSAIFLAAASVPAAAETGDDGGRLVIGQGANSCWAWTRSHEAKAATQGLYTQWVAGFVSGVSWEADDPDILTRMDFDGLTTWMHTTTARPIRSQKSPQARPCSCRSCVLGGMGHETADLRRRRSER